MYLISYIYLYKYEKENKVKKYFNQKFLKHVCGQDFLSMGPSLICKTSALGIC